MHTQVIRPAGAGHETLAVLGACLAIVAAAAGYIGLREAPPETAALAATQIDARRELTPAEQGIYADLRVAYDEIAFAVQAGEPLPSVADLAAQGLPPFVADNSTAARGGHAWRLQRQAGHAMYLGQTADAALAGSFLLRAQGAGAKDDHDHGHDHGKAADAQPDVWLARDAAARLPDPADDAALAAAGWRQVVAQFDAGVTRQNKP
ncbi:DUF6162 family protein [Achromobacter sp. MFA1 R4]|uniref:DUF6162 family protein n=1 Tax=Achromobacter sp. MFA1 R4 TaxID=1881016 RepID=UPI0009537AFE|nr:DUF6162 family protein [Achromobacter sp. MFA1 R4]SIT30733.1 hypothetical protein SAMN05428937_4740 [Achromobacter sp. MFA1 R4]